ncbi:M56/M15 family metallopeptidase [Mangrovivirga sp. M17]|uniref:N-acetylmuramoyl-L-alanine amidase n=1 Tax=Mangrovivirga halotolerans TaxID=2993936 RepID=A0ABT3RNB3_9BACT|nr:M56/M15 family metallopeptidase [Mangrovivirga halotolerans]MCX2743269.1 M56/M15 family metallopeptidase [Mangrovivirga halotolerans]
MNWGLYAEAPRFEVPDLNNTKIVVENPDHNTIATIKPESSIFIYLSGIFYLLISSIFLFRYFKNLMTISKNIRKSSKVNQSTGYILLTNQFQKYSFSFFNYIIIPKESLLNKKLTNTIIQHELTHVKELHTVDILLIELIKCFYWFNPMIWFIKNEISENHEYMADNNVIKQNTNVSDYIKQILSSIYHSRSGLRSGFSFVTTKNRLNMLTSNNHSTKKKWVRLILAMFLIAFTFSFTSFNPDKSDKDPFIVIIDAGHGGKDPGSPSEKEINLKISKEILNLSQNSNIKIILTRENDEYITLSERISFINNQKADMLLSIHCNNSENITKNGPEGYFSELNNKKAISQKATEILITNQVNKFSKEGSIKSADYKILREINIPGVLLELGYMSNKEDADFLLNPVNQKDIAKNILQSLNEVEKELRK